MFNESARPALPALGLTWGRAELTWGRAGLTWGRAELTWGRAELTWLSSYVCTYVCTLEITYV